MIHKYDIPFFKEKQGQKEPIKEKNKTKGGKDDLWRKFLFFAQKKRLLLVRGKIENVIFPPFSHCWHGRKGEGRLVNGALTSFGGYAAIDKPSCLNGNIQGQFDIFIEYKSSEFAAVLAKPAGFITDSFGQIRPA